MPLFSPWPLMCTRAFVASAGTSYSPGDFVDENDFVGERQRDVLLSNGYVIQDYDQHRRRQNVFQSRSAYYQPTKWPVGGADVFDALVARQSHSRDVGGVGVTDEDLLAWLSSIPEDEPVDVDGDGPISRWGGVR